MPVPNDLSPLATEAGFQHTLKAPIGCVGTGLHSGQRVSLTLRPGEPDSGIRFVRTDLGAVLPAQFDCVTDTKFCTVLGTEDPPASIGTIEHLMAAAAGCGVDNLIVEVDGPELPILDGSAAPFVFLLDCAGIVAQPVPRAAIEVLRPVRVEDGAAFAELRPRSAQPAVPGGTRSLEMALSIEFAAAAIGRQAFSLTLTPGSFRRELAQARTFVEADAIEYLRGAGLSRGGSLANAIVVDAARVLNPGGLRLPDEFVRHKLLDAVGDLALAGAPILGRFVAHRSGHTLNNRLLRALFAARGAWRVIGAEAPALRAAA